MKFRLLFIIFNAVIVVSFALIFLMPAIVLGWEYTRVFWSTNWPVALVFLLVLGSLNGYFVYNWKVFQLLEQEKWPELIEHIESRVETSRRASAQRARILINAYVVTGQVSRIRELEATLHEKSPRVVASLAIEFGIPYLLSDDAAAMESYFGEMKDNARASSPRWIRWCYAFALMSQQKFDDAKAELVAVLSEARDPLLRVLTAHMLEPFGNRDESVAQLVRDQRDAIRSRYTRSRLDRELERQRQNLQVLFLSSRIEEARDWVFSN